MAKAIDNIAREDRVAMASRRKDGTPDQTDNFEFIGNKETVKEAAKEQLGEQAASVADEQNRDKTIGERKKAQEAAMKSAESHAESEVEAHFAEPEDDGNGKPLTGAETDGGKATKSKK